MERSSEQDKWRLFTLGTTKGEDGLCPRHLLLLSMALEIGGTARHGLRSAEGKCRSSGCNGISEGAAETCGRYFPI